jgi:hypothetical protein
VRVTDADDNIYGAPKQHPCVCTPVKQSDINVLKATGRQYSIVKQGTCSMDSQRGLLRAATRSGHAQQRAEQDLRVLSLPVPELRFVASCFEARRASTDTAIEEYQSGSITLAGTAAFGKG